MRDVVSLFAFCYPFLAMPRQARLDAPDTLHRVMVRGLIMGDVFD